MVFRSLLSIATAAVLATAASAATTDGVVYENEVMNNPTTVKYKVPGAVMTFATDDTYTPYHGHDTSTLKGVQGEYYIVNGVRFADGDIIEIPAGTAYDSMFPENSTIANLCIVYQFSKAIPEEAPANIEKIDSVVVDPKRVIRFSQWSPLMQNDLHKSIEEWNAMDKPARDAFKAEYYYHSSPYHKL